MRFAGGTSLIMKRRFHVFKLKFVSPLHLAKGNTEYYDDSEEVLHSDSLMSALYACARTLSPSEPGEAFFNQFRISSAFPFYKDELFFPRPMLRLPEVKANYSSSKRSKLIKNLKFLGQSAFEQLISGKLDEIHPGNFIDLSQHFYSLSTSEETKAEIIKSEIQQRVSIPADRTNDPTPYYVERLHFTQNAGLFFLTECSEESLPLLRSALRLLGDQGIGTDKAVGNGQFGFQESQIDLAVPEVTNGCVCNLSLYCPIQEELTPEFIQNSSYQLIKRGGYLASPSNIENMSLRKKSVYFFTEGSVFYADRLIGKLIDLKPDTPLVNHPVWREGRPLFIPVKP